MSGGPNQIGHGERWQIGDVSIIKMVENTVPLPTHVLLPDVTQAHLDALPWIAPYFAPKDGEIRMRLSLHSFLIRSGGTTIVVDTCVGPDPERSLPGDPSFIDRLEASIDGGREAVDVVVCTHVHFDHVGWNTIEVDGAVVPTFPRARYLFTRAELDEVEADDHMGVLAPSIRPLLDAGMVDVIDLGGADDSGSAIAAHAITDEVHLISTPGHTAGHVSVAIESAGRRALITGDAFHSPIQVAHPEIAAIRFDTDSERSTQTRRRLLGRYGDGQAVMLGTHFAPPTGGVIRTAADGNRWFDATATEETATEATGAGG